MKRKINFLLFVHYKTAGKISDEQLVAAFRKGDSKCFDILVMRHEKRLWQIVCNTLDNNIFADDIVQETFIAAWNKISSGEYSDEERFGTWLSTIAYHAAITLLRKEKRLIHQEQLPEPVPEPLAGSIEKSELLDVLIEKLPERERQVIILHDIERKDYKQIGRQLGIHPDSARRTHERAVIDLKQMLGREK